MSARLLPVLLLAFLTPALRADVKVELAEGLADTKNWKHPVPTVVLTYSQGAFGIVDYPNRYTDRGVLADRPLPVLLTATETITLPAGEYRVLLRSRNAARLWVDQKIVLETKFIDLRGDGHEPVPERPAVIEPGLRELPIAHQEKVATITLDGKPRSFVLEAFVGGPKLRPEVGELVVAVARKGEPFRLLAATLSVSLTDEGWEKYAAGERSRLLAMNEKARLAARVEEDHFWQRRHELARREWQSRPRPADASIDHFIDRRLAEAKVAPTAMTDDLTFLRRATLDTTGVVPTPEEIDAFLKIPAAQRRTKTLDRLLTDPRWADHWVSYWQDVLAENPGILKPNLNNTGPFRWWLHRALLDNLSMDRFVTELVRMEGSKMYGGPAGFGVATENDSPMASKAHILAKAFLGVELQCARCHDAPFHPFKQKDLFEAAAMLDRKPIALPKTSTVPLLPGARKPRVEISLKPGEKIAPHWPFADLANAELPAGVLADPKDSRERLAAIITSPRNERFAEVLVNRLWHRWMGRGLVEPVDDWGDEPPSHPELLRYLARELIEHDYDLKHVARLILSSRAYQRVPESGDGTTERLFAGPARRRLSAEQLVDSLFLAAGKAMNSEELTMDPEARRPATEMLSLGVPTRAWQFTSLSNERDRPALALPQAQGVVDLLTAYGWRDSRQNPLTVRDETATPLQPMVLANGVVGNRVARLCDENAVTALCVQDRPLPDLIDAVFLRLLTRRPTATERQTFVNLLKDGYESRLVPGAKPLVKKKHSSAVSWANHLSPEATRIKLELERQARAGDPPTPRLTATWRERMEDMVWSLVNTPEFAHVP